MTGPYGTLLAIDKPEGISSFDVIRRLRQEAGKVKAGHAGTLDQPASGLLLVCTGRATRFIRYFQDMPKEYTAQIQLGIRTTTDDLSGEILEESPVACAPDPDALLSILPRFSGTIRQIPPAYSALKIGGRRSSDLARAGEEVPLREREVVIHSLEAEYLASDRISIRVRCSKGTYIRSLGRDMARALGHPGTIRTLRRTAIGAFRVEDALPGGAITRESVLERAESMDRVLADLPAMVVPSGEQTRVAHGILPEDLPPSGGGEWLRLLDAAGTLLAVLRHEGKWGFFSVYPEVIHAPD